jgi:hypothetical protein
MSAGAGAKAPAPDMLHSSAAATMRQFAMSIALFSFLSAHGVSRQGEILFIKINKEPAAQSPS